MRKRIDSIGAMVVSDDPAKLDRRLGEIADIGFDHAELSATHCAAIVGGALNPTRLRQVVEAVRAHRLATTVHAPLILNFMDLDRADLHRAVARASVDFCEAVEASVMVIHPGWVAPEALVADRERLLEQERAALAGLARHAETRGVVLALENMPVVLESVTGRLDNHGISPASVAAQIAAVDHPNLRGTIDLSHAHLAACHRGVDLAADLIELAPLTRHLHLHDSFGRAPTLSNANYREQIAYGMGDIHLPLGWGNIPFESVLGRLPLPGGLSATLEINGVYADREVLAESLARARAIADHLDRRAA